MGEESEPRRRERPQDQNGQIGPGSQAKAALREGAVSATDLIEGEGAMKLRTLFLLVYVGGLGWVGPVVLTMLGAMLDIRDDHGDRMYPVRPECDLWNYVREYELLLDLEDEVARKQA